MANTFYSPRSTASDIAKLSSMVESPVRWIGKHTLIRDRPLIDG